LRKNAFLLQKSKESLEFFGMMLRGIDVVKFDYVKN